MQDREDAQRGYLDVEALAGELLVRGGVFAFLAEHRGCCSGFDDGGFLLLRAGSVLVLQELHGLSDRETAEALTIRSDFGLVPGENSSGQSRHQGPITKAGNTDAPRFSAGLSEES